MRFDEINARVQTLWMPRRDIILRWLLALTIGMLLSWVTWQYLSRPAVLKIAVGPEGSARHKFITTVSERLAEGSKSIRLKLVTTKTGEAATELLNADAVQLAVLRSDQQRVEDARSFAIIDRRAILLIASASPPTPPPVAPVAQEQTGVAVAAAGAPSLQVASTALAKVEPKAAEDTEASEGLQSSGPLSPSRLLGRRFVLAGNGFGSSSATIARLLAHSGLSGDVITLTELPTNEIAPALAAKSADVAVIIVDPTTEETRKLVSDISSALGGKAVVGPPPAPEALLALNRELTSMDIPAGLLGGGLLLPAKKITTVALTEELVGDSDIEEATAAQLTKALLEVRGRLTLRSGESFEIEAPPLDTLRRFMPHSGVGAHINERSTTFLEKYSDQIWLILFAVGLIGSSIAGFAGRLGLTGPKPTPDPLPQEITHALRALSTATTTTQIDVIRERLRTLAAERLQRALARGQDATAASHPNQWFPLTDALATSRLHELELKSGQHKSAS